MDAVSTIDEARHRCLSYKIRAKRMTMGFNTDIKYNGVVYHVQTEIRKDGGFETTVFTHGAVVHKFKTASQNLLNSADYHNEDRLKRSLEDQHRQVIIRIRAGLVVPAASPTASSQA